MREQSCRGSTVESVSFAKCCKREWADAAEAIVETCNRASKSMSQGYQSKASHKRANALANRSTVIVGL